jgi:hypothetical protein
MISGVGLGSLTGFAVVDSTSGLVCEGFSWGSSILGRFARGCVSKDSSTSSFESESESSTKNGPVRALGLGGPWSWGLARFGGGGELLGKVMGEEADNILKIIQTQKEGEDQQSK